MSNTVTNWLLGLLAVLMVVSIVMISNQPEPTQVDIDYDAIASAAASKIVIPSAPVANLSKLDELYEDHFNESNKVKGLNATAKDLAVKQLSEKIFLKQVQSALNNSNQSVESYKDLEIYSSKVVSSNLGSNNATVVVEFKVKFFNDGDAEDSEKARLVATFYVVDLDTEDEDPEVDESNTVIVVDKVYD